MTSRYSVEDSRHYKNPYEDYCSEEHKALINIDNNDIQNDFKETLKTSTKSWLKLLEKSKNLWNKKNDISMYTGISGIAYLFYHYGKTFDDAAYISQAIDMVEHIDKPKGKHYITFLTGSAGALALEAVIHYNNQETSKMTNSINKLKVLGKYVHDDVPDEMLYGRSGYLYSLLFINSRISPSPIEDDLIKQVIDLILQSGKVYATKNRIKSPLMYSWHDQEYLGGAHGLAGILYLLLQARQYLTKAQLDQLIEPSLLYLLEQRYPSGNFMSSVGSTSDRLVHWCHGAPSMTMLFCLAYEVFGKETYLQTAVECGEVVWTRGLLKKGYSICHGVSGNAYTFLSLFQQTKNLKYLYRACKFAEWCMDYGSHQTRSPDRPFSLFEGLAGTIYFLTDMQHPESAKFPGYTL